MPTDSSSLLLVVVAAVVFAVIQSVLLLSLSYFMGRLRPAAATSIPHQSGTAATGAPVCGVIYMTGEFCFSGMGDNPFRNFYLFTHIGRMCPLHAIQEEAL